MNVRRFATSLPRLAPYRCGAAVDAIVGIVSLVLFGGGDWS